MVAVLTVFANHLWGWPKGGFIGVDVFFVISGFLITGNLLRSAEKNGNVKFLAFYWNRVRRIVPAATVTLIATYLVAVILFLPFRAHNVGVDALFAFIFFANWHFAIQNTNYFSASDSVSPIQHFWSLSIEEQFYFVWPALIFIISLLVARRAWTHGRRMILAAAVMGVASAASLAWALYETATSPTWAYFNTFSRVWELGAGALLATAVGTLARIPAAVKPLLSWAGLTLIAASLFVISDESTGFPAPWALLPAVGTLLVIAAGVGEEPRYQGFLNNPVSTYIGNFSYSLYLIHWPVIVFLGAMMDGGIYYYLTAIVLAFGLAIASYHFIENPFRHIDRTKMREAGRQLRTRDIQPERSTGYAALAAVTLVIAGLVLYVGHPTPQSTLPPAVAGSDVGLTQNQVALPTIPMGTLGTALHGQIVDALKATAWPTLDPTMESVITGPPAPDEVAPCGMPAQPNPDQCTWGSPTAPLRVILVGDSIAMTYAGPLRDIALDSGGQIQVRSEAMYGCQFDDDLVTTTDPKVIDACPGRKKEAVDIINATKPNLVIISSSYVSKKIRGTGQEMTPGAWTTSLQKIVDQFKNSAQKIVFLAPPPADKQIKDCYGKRSSTPADCISTVKNQWTNVAAAEADLATTNQQTWIDSRPWFCNDKYCPAFVDTTPTKFDLAHMSPAYGQKIYPIIRETLTAAGVL
jgi:peptidoglycan/LPS O-acetylase OafA/YrhL